MAVKNKKKWRKVQSVDQFAHLAEQGVRFQADHSMYFETPREGTFILRSALYSAVNAVKKGIFYEAKTIGPEAGQDTVLRRAQDAIRATGLSDTQIAEKVGVSRQAVNKFLTAESVQTRVLERYLQATGASL